MVTVPVRGQKPYDEILNAALQQLEDDRVAGDDALDGRLDDAEADLVGRLSTESLDAEYVPVITPEQFPSATDQEALASAIDHIGDTGQGVIRLKPGKTYTWSGPVGDYEVMNGRRLVIDATGATINWTGSTGSPITFRQSSYATLVNPRPLVVLGGDWNDTTDTLDIFFNCIDLTGAIWQGCRPKMPGGTFVQLFNLDYWSERNQFLDISDNKCREIVRFACDSPLATSSFDRTVVDRVWIQGGVAGYAKFNMIDSVEVGAPQCGVAACTFSNIKGNIAADARVMRLAGSMSNTELGTGWDVECNTGTGYFFELSSTFGSSTNHPYPALRHLPLLTGRNMALYVAQSGAQPFEQTWFPAGLIANGAVVEAELPTTLNSAGAITMTASRANFFLLVLNANCTSSTISGAPAAPPGAPGTVTQTITIAWQQGAAGGHTYVWPTNCKFAGNSAPSDTTANTITSVTFRRISTGWIEVARAVAVPIP